MPETFNDTAAPVQRSNDEIRRELSDVESRLERRVAELEREVRDLHSSQRLTNDMVWFAIMIAITVEVFVLAAKR